eukprot:3242797-Prymnesium_polylepis.1
MAKLAYLVVSALRARPPAARDLPTYLGAHAAPACGCETYLRRRSIVGELSCSCNSQPAAPGGATWPP